MNKQSFWHAARAGMRDYTPPAIGLLPWATATGMAMHGAGLSFAESMGMSIIVYGATAQLGTLPLLVSGASYWLIFCTALILNLRFLIFSATLSPVFSGTRRRVRCLAGYLMSDGVMAAFSARLLAEPDKDKRLGLYFGPSLMNWVIWQLFTVIGILAGASLPGHWPIGFLATISLLTLTTPMVSNMPMAAAAAVTAAVLIVLHTLPFRLGFLLAIIAGMLAGYVVEQYSRKDRHAA
ncbi:AzlC family ABC transporter permease [Vogesella sp. LYT5W]|uniref:AzlC family ABC transporter permease n=1 Tax=Vogesella margarita TaxID=2984199 RepID=A0ABT5IM75_9NEIS|nr:AzlC family ABC transporter permease [Vogesella margarita]MDC7713655.1 AzlC family ABC transporter permease [Vogesella margarita]